MSVYQKFLLCLTSTLLLLLTGCAAQDTYDYSALENSKPRSIVVIPPKNNTVKVNAPYVFLSTITRPLVEKGYYVFPVSVIDHLFKENGLPTPAEMNSAPLDKIREHIGADAVLYVELEEWGQKYELLASRVVVKAHLKLVDAKTGASLWGATAFAQQSSGDGGAGLVGMLAGAIVNQIAGSISDRTPALSRNANNAAINNTRAGLLNGPYAQEEQ